MSVINHFGNLTSHLLSETSEIRTSIKRVCQFYLWAWESVFLFWGNT